MLLFLWVCVCVCVYMCRYIYICITKNCVFTFVYMCVYMDIHLLIYTCDYILPCGRTGIDSHSRDLLGLAASTSNESMPRPRSVADPRGHIGKAQKISATLPVGRSWSLGDDLETLTLVWMQHAGGSSRRSIADYAGRHITT